MSKSKFGHKMQRKSWDSSEINKEREDGKIMIAFLIIFAAMILLAIVIWKLRKP